MTGQLRYHASWLRTKGGALEKMLRVLLDLERPNDGAEGKKRDRVSIHK